MIPISGKSFIFIRRGMETKTMYDALYARQSLDKKESISIESQFDTCKHEARGNDFKKYEDKGYSGKNLNRPDFERLCQDIERGLIKRVIVYKLDRISRSILDFSNLMIYFEKYGVEFVSTTEKFDTSTPVGRAMLNICIVFAQLERETIQQRVTDAYHSRSKKGFYMGGRCPYGFKKDKETITIEGIKTSKYMIDEQESSHLKLMVSMYSDNSNSLKDIIKHFVENDIKNPRGKPWTTSVISRMMSSPLNVQADENVYEFFKSQGAIIMNDVSEFKGQGIYLYQGESTTRKQTDLKDKVVVLAPHQGFIPSEEWLKCKIRCLNNKTLSKTCKGKNSWLLGKTKCSNCGYALVAVKNRNNRYYFYCSNQQNMKNCKGTGGTLHVDVVEEYIFNEIKEKISAFKTLSNYERNKENPRVKENEIKLIQIDNEINDLLTKVTGANNILMDYINKKVEELDLKRQRLQQENISIRQSVKMDKMNKVYNHVEDWKKTSFEDKQSVLDILVKVIHIKSGEIDITWNI